MLMYALASRARTCISPIIPAQPTPILSVILKTFLATLLITKVPYEYRRSEASIAPSLQTTPTVVAPGMKPSSLISFTESRVRCPVAINVASTATFQCLLEGSAPTPRHDLEAFVVDDLRLREAHRDGSNPLVPQ